MGDIFRDFSPEDTPDEVVFDLVEYVAASVAKPIVGKWHDYLRHHELSFDRAGGFAEFRDQINLLLRRGGVIYELDDDGQIRRTGTAQIQSVVTSLVADSGDEKLDTMLAEALSLYISHKTTDRVAGLQRLWAAFERLKTIDVPGDGKKRQSAKVLLSAFEAHWRLILESEMKSLTDIGNAYDIRHSETYVLPVPDDAARDYLFGRMGSLLVHLLDGTNRLRK